MHSKQESLIGEGLNAASNNHQKVMDLSTDLAMSCSASGVEGVSLEAVQVGSFDVFVLLAVAAASCSSIPRGVLGEQSC